MRTRVLIAALAFAAVSVLSVSAPAGAAGTRSSAPAATAQSGGADVSKASEECIKLLEEGKEVKSCQEAPSPILPPINELIWGTLSFLIVLFLLWKLAYPAIKKGMEGRTERIRSDLDAADAAKAEANEVLSGYQAQLADARSESARIIEEARQAADEVRTNLQAKAEADIAELRARANADIEAAKQQAVADLRSEVAALAIGAAEQVVERSLDRETNVALVERYIDQVGAGR
ncbi:MAG: F0F1 ATP synthase subunit B [Acidimicrobiales bacterium]